MSQKQGGSKKQRRSPHAGRLRDSKIRTGNLGSRPTKPGLSMLEKTLISSNFANKLGEARRRRLGADRKGKVAR